MRTSAKRRANAIKALAIREDLIFPSGAPHAVGFDAKREQPTYTMEKRSAAPLLLTGILDSHLPVIQLAGVKRSWKRQR